MSSSDPAPTDRSATSSRTPAAAAVGGPDGAAPVGTRPLGFTLHGKELPALSLDAAATKALAAGTRVLVVMVRDRRASARN